MEMINKIMKMFQLIYLCLLPIVYLVLLHYFGFEVTVVYILGSILVELYRKDLKGDYEKNDKQ
jgi:hypothetical protein